MWPLVTYSYYFEIVSTVHVSFLAHEPGLVEVCFCLTLFIHYKQGIIYAAPGF